MAPSTRRLLLVLGLAVASIVGLTLVVRSLIDPTLYQGLLVAQLQRRLGREVSVASAAAVVWPAPGLSLRGLVIAENPPVPGSPFLTADRLRVAVRFLPLVRGRVIIERLVIERPVITVARDANGALSVADLLRERQQKPDGTTSDEPSKAGVDLSQARVEIVGGDLTLVDRAAPEGSRTTRVGDLTIDVAPRGERGRRIGLEARIGADGNGGSLALDATVERLPEPWRLVDLPVRLRLRLQRVDLRRTGAFLPERWRTRIPGGLLTADLSIDGAAAAEVAVGGTLRLEQADLGSGAIRLTGTIDADIEGTHEGGVVAGKGKLRLAPGRFALGGNDIVIDGHANVDATIRADSAEMPSHVLLDATRARVRIADVFAKAAGTGLILEGDLARTEQGVAVRKAKGHLGKVAIAGSAEIGRSPGPGRPPPLALHFGPTALDLDGVSAFVAATKPFALAGRARVQRLDILRRPGAAREWQVTIDADVADARARLPVGAGRAHVVDALSAVVHIKPGLLTAERATARLNGVPLTFEAKVDEFMTLLSADRRRKRADIEFSARGTSVDIGALLTPPTEDEGGGASRAGDTREASTPAQSGSLAARPLADRLGVRRGTLHAPEATYLGQPLTDLDVTIAYGPRVLRLQPARFAVHGGRGVVDGTVTFDGGPTFALSIQAADVRLASISASTPVTMRGIVGGTVRLVARGDSFAAWQPTLDGSGTVTVRDGQMPGFNLLDALARAMLGVFSFVPGARNVSLAGSNPFDRFEHVFRLTGDGITEDTVTLETRDYRLTGRGGITFDGTTRFDTRVSLTATGTQKLLTVVALPIPGGSAVKLPGIPVKVTGKLGALRIVPDVTGITLSPFRALGGAGGKAIGATGAAVGGGARAVGRGVKRLFGRGQGAAEDSPASSPPPEGAPPEPAVGPAQSGPQ